jgi:hypothetical protein
LDFVIIIFLQNTVVSLASIPPTSQRHSSSGESSASHRGGPGSIPDQVSGICGGQSGTGAGFIRVLRFPLPILIPPTAP